MGSVGTCVVRSIKSLWVQETRGSGLVWMCGESLGEGELSYSEGVDVEGWVAKEEEGSLS